MSLNEVSISDRLSKSDVLPLKSFRKQKKIQKKIIL